MREYRSSPKPNLYFGWAGITFRVGWGDGRRLAACIQSDLVYILLLNYNDGNPAQL